MTSVPFTPDRADHSLRLALAPGGNLRRLPAAVETAFREHQQERATDLLRRRTTPLLGLLALALLPAVLFRHDPSLLPWALGGALPITLNLLMLASATRLRALAPHMGVVMGVGLFICLCAALGCALFLDGRYFGHFSKFLVIYVLIASYTILHLPLRVATPATAAALAAVCLAGLAWRGPGTLAGWLDVTYYAVVPAVMCTLTGWTLETVERRNFAQRWLLERESAELAALHAEAERNLEAQARQAEYLALIGGNHSLEELFTRTLRFLVAQTGAQVGVAWQAGAQGRLRQVAGWALDAQARARGEVAAGDTLMGPVLRQGETMVLRQVRADYLRVDLGMGSLPCAALMILPVTLAGRPLAVIELGTIGHFDDEATARADAIRTHLAYAVTAANARAPQREDALTA
jgi:hypothetical protein